jgi:cytochrome c-type biogenesis protein CcmH/NrfG
LALAIKADPTNGQALMTLANIYRDAKNYTAAEQYYYRATSIASVKMNALLGLAQTFLEQQNYKAALDNLIALSKLDPHNEDIARNIASIKRILVARG